MVPIVSVVGRTNSGKTTLIEKLIPVLNRRGYRIGTIKHHHHGDFEADQKGKDSWRHAQAGAQATALVSASRVAIFQRVEVESPVDQVVQLFLDPLDLILTEGYKEHPFPKIEVIRREQECVPLCQREDYLIALVTDGDWELGVPRFGLDEAERLADLLEQRFLKRQNEEPHIELLVNGRAVPMIGFVQKLVRSTILAIVSSLQGGEHPHQVTIRIQSPWE